MEKINQKSNYSYILFVMFGLSIINFVFHFVTIFYHNQFIVNVFGIEMFQFLLHGTGLKGKMLVGSYMIGIIPPLALMISVLYFFKKRNMRLFIIPLVLGIISLMFSYVVLLIIGELKIFNLFTLISQVLFNPTVILLIGFILALKKHALRSTILLITSCIAFVVSLIPLITSQLSIDQFIPISSFIQTCSYIGVFLVLSLVIYKSVEQY